MKTTELLSSVTMAQLGNLDTESKLAMIEAIVGKAENETYNDEAVRQLISEARTIAEEARTKAGILDDLEKGQIESMILQLLENVDLQSLYEGMTVDIGGTAYTIMSVVGAIASSPEIKKVDIIRDANNAISGVKVTLTDDTTATLAATHTMDDVTDKHTSVYVGAIKGYAVEKKDVFGFTTATKKGVTTKTPHVESEGSLVFDLTTNFVIPATRPTNIDAADIDDNGTAGNTE
ncbi:MAG: Unknown protein [uncultured Sulfurovum sp.]|uniref:Uncharacterized protein n=1 Tax=uncultured Sulfurovum sp. TaxID=269237 RepID=A0A6S6SNW6_9BACT|nr:MAG: Unknown protein [uncultured Sulfurovum sp.]